MAKKEVIATAVKGGLKNVKGQVSPLVALDSFNLLVKSHSEYKQVVAVEKTKREAIKAWKETRLASLSNQNKFLKSYLEQTFAERKHVISEMFERLDDAIESDNIEAMSMMVSSIVSIVKSSPLQEAAEVLNALNDPNVKSIDF